ncbi:hypothetical protein [Paraburkholderia rhynchosiae]|uniref:Quinol:cytochrome C oxidoreductase n=1 Tax=Paraburkholderia rhynchosiae TaxID=487049 RepID=A0A6J5CAW3_9BURK|nr:hypothetical protein [Paraburkholderia rhynchosiae]CAB3732419.1 hypothetical protein LMG27174_05928 [Paraburkholderia rhynchosiae]
MNRHLPLVALLAMVAGCVAAWLFAPAAFLGAYLATWWFCCGLVMGGLANVWVHNLTGGRWGEAIRVPLLELSRLMWILALLFLPVLIGMHELYPWAPRASAGVQRWAGELPAQSAWFKNIWLTPWLFVVRSVFYLAVWTLLASLSRQPTLRRSPRFSAASLIVYGLTVSLAAVDWVMSLMPLWYSSVFGMLAGVSQALAGMALAALLATRSRPLPPPIIFRDLGNLLLMYVMTWAYLVFTQFLIIWAEDLPHEIAWYIPRMKHGWLYIAWLLALFHFFAPLLILLFRNAKEAPALLGWLAAGLLAAHQLDVWWTVFPSLPVGWLQWLWTAPLTTIAFCVAAYVAAKRGASFAAATAAGAGHV